LDSVILTLNAGSSSLKFAAFRLANGAEPALLASGQIEGIGATAKGAVKTASGETAELSFEQSHRVDHAAAMGAILGWLKKAGYDSSVAAVGHRIVHGGPDFVEPVLIDNGTLANLRALIPLAPLHQPHNIAGIEAAMKAFPSTPQVACFDTAFHRGHPFINDTYALPRSCYDEGVRRYGFHGLSYEYITSVLPRLAPEAADGKVVVAHLGNGASMCAIEHGRSIASTMGFTAVDGLPMGTRTGVLDPGVILYLLQHERMDATAIEHLIYERSGLLGVSGLSSDMRTLLASDLPAAREAVDLFVYRIGRELGSLVAALGGLDALVFTGGIGEHAPEIRGRVCQGASWLGVALDADANAAGGPRISKANSPISAWVVPTDENLMIARHTRRLLDARESS
jgi:acetate kinase